MSWLSRLHLFRNAIRAGIAARRGDLAAVALGFAIAMVAPAHAADLPRIASINLCTDQLLMTLADPAQIVGLSPYSRDAARSYAADEARNYRRLSGEAEDVLMLGPDVVVATPYTKHATRELLKQQGMRVDEFDVANSVEDVKDQIRRMGDLVRHPDRAEMQISRLDAAIARARKATARKRYQAGTNMRAWLFVILRNQFLSQMRRSRFKGEWDEGVAERTLSTPAHQDHQMQLSDLQRALMRLPAAQREALILVGAGGFSYEEAASICDCAIGTVKSRVARARVALDEMISSGQLPGRSESRLSVDDTTAAIMSEMDKLTQ